MKLRYFVPLIGFVVPTLVIGFGFVIPGSPIEGWNSLTVGFVSTVVGACVTFYFGIWAVVKELGTVPGGGASPPAAEDGPPAPRSRVE